MVVTSQWSSLWLMYLLVRMFPQNWCWCLHAWTVAVLVWFLLISKLLFNTTPLSLLCVFHNFHPEFPQQIGVMDRISSELCDPTPEGSCSALLCNGKLNLNLTPEWTHDAIKGGQWALLMFQRGLFIWRFVLIEWMSRDWINHGYSSIQINDRHKIFRYKWQSMGSFIELFIVCSFIYCILFLILFFLHRAFLCVEFACSAHAHVGSPWVLRFPYTVHRYEFMRKVRWLTQNILRCEWTVLC